MKYTPKLINWLRNASVNALICFLFVEIPIFLHIKHYLLSFNVIFRTDLEQKFIKKTPIVVMKVRIPFVYLVFFHIVVL